MPRVSKVASLKEMIPLRDFVSPPTDDLKISFELKPLFQNVLKQLELTYRIEGEALKNIQIEALKKNPQRKDDLWKSTCFELFGGEVQSPAYFELNLSLTGDWNVYQFSNYRAGMTPAKVLVTPQIELQRSANLLEVQIRLSEIDQFIQLKTLEFQPAVVLFHQSQKICSYWTSQHPSPKADFHTREKFIPWKSK